MNPLLQIETTKIVVWDIHGRVWHLHGVGAGKEGVRLTRQSGYMFAPVQLLVSEGARQDGATFLRSVRSKKEWDFVVLLRADSVRGFHAVHDAWHRGWSTDIPCKVGYFTRHQGWRYQLVQLDNAPEPLGDIDPTRNRAIEYQMSAAAMDPLARHLIETEVWVNADGLGEGIVRGRNAADQPAWARYTMNGPGRYAIQDPNFGDTLRIVETPLLAGGEELRIDTHPRHRTARVYSDANPDGDNVWGKLAGRHWFQPLPAWSSTEIIVRVTEGATLESTVRIDVTSRSSRPF
ncbi:phage tail protein [Nocardia vinacea]|uniref:phage tail protein n=1 Tax=Nocardia vinacea TaxID=96468 RepID=UPI002E139928|nr:phage tail protein [Nocardia vinacea]